MNIQQIIDEWGETKDKISKWPWDEDDAIGEDFAQAVGPRVHYDLWDDIMRRKAQTQAQLDSYFITRAPQTIDTLVKALEKAKKVLEFYGEKDNYDYSDEYADDCVMLDDFGQKARELLKEWNNETKGVNK